MIGMALTDHEPVQGPALRRALDVILARPVVELPTPDETQILEQRKASGRIAAQNATRKYQERKAAQRPAFDRRAVGDDLARGMSILDVTAKHGISDTTAKKIRNERKLPRQHWGTLAAYDHGQALRDLDQGMTPREVAAKHGVHYQTINKLRRERGDRT